MTTYLDGMDGGKHDSNNIEVSSIGGKSYEVILRFNDVIAKNPLEATKKILKWIQEDADNMIYEVNNEDNTNESFTVDLSESDENAVLPI
jgi:hypothetical protein